MRLSHDLLKTHALFDDRHLESHAGLVPVLALAERAGLDALLGGYVRVGGPCGVNAAVKAGCLVAGMAVGAAGIRAPSTLGSFLRSFTWGNVRGSSTP